MPRIWNLPAPAAAFWAGLVLVVVAAGTPVPAQEPDPAAAEPAESIAADADTAQAVASAAEPSRRKHPNLFGVSLRGQYRIPVKVLKENARDINDLFAAGGGFDAGVRWYALDGMALTLRYTRGGLAMTDNVTDLGRFPQPPGLQGDETLTLDAYSFSLIAYLGGALFPESATNPYLVATLSRYDWSFNQGARDSDPYYILDTDVADTDTGIGLGLGAERPLTGNLLLELEWTWNYVRTELDQTEGEFSRWTNTHYWQLAGGLVWTF